MSTISISSIQPSYVYNAAKNEVDKKRKFCEDNFKSNRPKLKNEDSFYASIYKDCHGNWMPKSFYNHKRHGKPIMWNELPAKFVAASTLIYVDLAMEEAKSSMSDVAKFVINAPGVAAKLEDAKDNLISDIDYLNELLANNTEEKHWTAYDSAIEFTPDMKHWLETGELRPLED